MHVPAGTSFAFGNYNIVTTKRRPGGAFREIIISYRAGSPVIPLFDGSLHFRCELTSEEFGAGLAEGVAVPIPLGNGMIQQDIRNVLTFSDAGGL